MGEGTPHSAGNFLPRYDLFLFRDVCLQIPLSLTQETSRLV